MNKTALPMFRLMVEAAVGAVINLTPERSRSLVLRAMSSELMVFAAELHKQSAGSSASFLKMATRSLALVETGVVEQ